MDNTTFEDSRGGAKVERLSSWVVRVEISGRPGPETADFLWQRLDSELRGRRQQHLFWDLELLEGYHSSVRVRSVEILNAHRPEIATLHAFTTSRLVAMGVSVANLALGGIVHVYRDRSSFEQDMNAILRHPAPSAASF